MGGSEGGKGNFSPSRNMVAPKEKEERGGGSGRARTGKGKRKMGEDKDERTDCLSTPPSILFFLLGTFERKGGRSGKKVSP